MIQRSNPLRRLTFSTREATALRSLARREMLKIPLVWYEKNWWSPAEREAKKNPSDKQDLEKPSEGRDKPPAETVEQGKRSPKSPWMGGGSGGLLTRSPLDYSRARTWKTPARVHCLPYLVVCPSEFSCDAIAS